MATDPNPNHSLGERRDQREQGQLAARQAHDTVNFLATSWQQSALIMSNWFSTWSSAMAGMASGFDEAQRNQSSRRVG